MLVWHVSEAMRKTRICASIPLYSCRALNDVVFLGDADVEAFKEPNLLCRRDVICLGGSTMVLAGLAAMPADVVYK